MQDRLSERSYEHLVREGVNAAKSGRHHLARTLLQRAARQNPVDARPWVWLSATTDDPEEKRAYLERAVAADPTNTAARRGLVALSGKLDLDRVLAQGAGVAPPAQDGPEDAEASAFSCPQCGGRVTFDASQSDLTCEYCGHSMSLEAPVAAEESETPVDFVLPTSTGHLWAEGHVRLTCSRCGADTLLDNAQHSSQCPYCGSNQMVEHGDASDLIDPQLIGLMQMEAPDAEQLVRDWIRKDKLAPDDLRNRMEGLKLRPAYYPFWTFDGALEARWTCEVREGLGDNERWVPTSGGELQLFDDVLVPGMKALSPRHVRAIEPFGLKKLVELRPEHLAGWDALAYDRSMADASLIARERVVKTFGREMHYRVLPGQEKRNLRISAGNWSGLTFKHVLLPLWVGSYRYRGETFPVLVNGQSGRVSGEKPRDQVKVAMVWVGTTLIVLLIVAILALLAFAYQDSILAFLQALLSES